MLNFEQGQRAAATAADSYNSAAREQEKYNESLEARINRMKTAWIGFADAMGGTVVYDSIVVATAALEKLGQASDDGASSLAIASIGVAALATPLLMLNTRLTANISTALAATFAQKAMTVSATSLTGSLYATAASATAAGTAIRGLMIATGVGAAIALLTTGITLLINKLSEAKQASEEFDAYLEKGTLALTDNRVEVDRLLESYDRLSAKRASGVWDATDEEEYLSVQNKLAELFPAIIDSVDANGNAHLKSNVAIEQEIATINKLIEAENKLKVVQAEDTFKDRIKDVNSLKKEVESLNERLTIRNLTGGSAKGTAELELSVLKLEKEIADKSAEIRYNILEISNAFMETGTVIDKVVSSEISKSLEKLDFSNMDSEELSEFAKSLSVLTVSMNDAFKSGNDKGFEKARESINGLFEATNNFNPELAGLTSSIKDMDAAISNVSGIEGMATEFDETGEVTDALAKKIDDLTKKAYDLKSAEEQLVGVSTTHTESSNQLLFMYDQLTSRMEGYTDAQIQDLLIKPKLTTQEQAVVNATKQREEVLMQLMVLYPEFAQLQNGAISLSAQQVEAMRQEEKANKVLLEAYKLSSEGKYSAEQNATLIQAEATKIRIENIKSEIQALDLLRQEAKKAYADIIATENLKTNDNAARGAMRASSLVASSDSRIEQNYSSIASEYSSLDSIISKIDNFNVAIKETDKEAKKVTNSTKKSKEETEKSIYITDKYKQSMEELNAAIAKQQSMQTKYPTHSASYRKAVEAEIKLKEKQLDLMKQEQASLEKQIKTGKIAQTGNVKVSSSKSSSANVSGYGRLTSTQGMRTHPVTGERSYHAGVDLASARGTRLDSLVNGKVVKQGSNSISGNYIQIMDDKGIKYFFGHLDKIMTKLGDTISTGQQIGTIGSTGRSTGSHLHFEAKDSSGKQLDALSLVKDAMKGVVTTSTVANATISNTKQNIDEAKSELNSLTSDIISQSDSILALQEKITQSYLDGFSVRRSELDSNYAFEEAKILNVDKANSKYNTTLDNMNNILLRKQKVNKEELAYVEGLIKDGKLSANTLFDMKNKTLELKTSIQELTNQMGQLRFDNFLNALDSELDKHSKILEFESAKIDELDKNSGRYSATLEKMNKHINSQSIITQEAIDSLNSMISSGKYSGTVLEDMRDKVSELTVDLKGLASQINDNNYEIVVGVKNSSDERVDDLQFELGRSEFTQSRYAENSNEYMAEMNKQISLYEELAKVHDDTRRELQKRLSTVSLYPEQIKEVTELMEDETDAYQNALKSISELQNTIAETNKKTLSDIADNAIDALKSAIESRKDEHLNALEEESKAEKEASDKRKKMWDDETELFKKNINDRLDAIDKAESERDYQMSIDELSSERSKLQSNLSNLALDNSIEAKSRRKELQKQLDDIDKEIAEARHDREIELQKEALSNLIDAKEEENSARQLLEDEQYNKTAASIDKQKAYWEKYYTDLANDERKFAEIRKDIMAGNFNSITKELSGYAKNLESTMGSLRDTLDGSMKAVGTSIRQNVIDELRSAINSMKDFEKLSVSVSSDFKNNISSDNFNPNSSKGNSYSGNASTEDSKGSVVEKSEGSYSSLNSNDYKVMFGKYLSDIVGMGLSVGSTRDAVKNEGQKWAKEGRSGGSVIPVDSGFNTEFSKLSSEQQSMLKSFIRNNADILSGSYKNRITKGIASLDTGGYLNFGSSSGGIDGKGGKLIVGHDKEVMLNKVDTARLLSNIEVSDSLTNSLMSMASYFGNMMNKIMPGNNNDWGLGNIEVNFGDVYNATPQSARNFADEFISSIKRTKGR